MSENEAGRDETDGQAKAPSLKDELDAISTIGLALGRLDEAARARAIEFVLNRFGLKAPTPLQRRDERPATSSRPERASPAPAGGFADFAALYDTARPTSDTERALVAGYWFQVQQNQPDFASQQLNDALKNLGHGIGNITDALERLKDRNPNLVRQLQKSGSSKQARKKYRLTEAGVRALEEMLTRPQEGDA